MLRETFVAVQKRVTTVTGVNNKGPVRELRFSNVLKLTEQQQHARSRQKPEKRYRMFA